MVTLNICIKECVILSIRVELQTHTHNAY